MTVGLTLIALFVSPLLHKYATPDELAVNVTMLPEQLDVLEGLIETEGTGLTVTITEAVPVHPL